MAPLEEVWPFLAEPEKVFDWYLPLKRFEYTKEQRDSVGRPSLSSSRLPAPHVARASGAIVEKMLTELNGLAEV